MNDVEQYELSQYETISILKKSDSILVELVENPVEKKKYVKKTYYEDKRNIFDVLKNISSRYLVKIEKVFFGSETIIIEEYVDGVLLSDLIGASDTTGELKSFDAKRTINSLISAVEILHLNGIIHRDIKPSNIIIKSNGDAVLIDYGIARFYDISKDSDTELFGTIGYAPPEQFGFGQSDYKSDIYALGKTIEKIEEVAKIPRAYKAIARKCREFDPSRRYQTAGEIRRNLKKRKLILVGLIILIVVIIIAWVIIEGNAIRQRKNEIIMAPDVAEDSGNVEAVKITEDTDNIKTVKITEDIDNMEPTEIAGDFETCESMILSVLNLEDKIRCFRVYDEEKTTQIDINGKITLISFLQEDGVLNLLIDDKEYDFTYDFTGFIKSYDDTEMLSEIVVYDWNQDGTEEIIPVICEGRLAEEQGYILKNGSVAWCLYLDKDGTYKLADGIASSTLDPLSITIYNPDIILGDYPVGFRLIDGTIVEME